MHGGSRNVCRILVKFEAKKSFWISTHICEDNIKMNYKCTGYKRIGWIHLAVDRDQWQAVVNMVMNLEIP
jgi:hypothetical protein